MKICRNKNHEQPCELYEKCPVCSAISCMKNWKDFRHSCAKRLKSLEGRKTKPCQRCDRPMKGRHSYCTDCREALETLSKDLLLIKKVEQK